MEDYIPKVREDKCKCGAESEYGIHGVCNGETYHYYMCGPCRSKYRVDRRKKENVDEQPTEESSQRDTQTTNNESTVQGSI
jgi:hypothetical protein